MKKMIVMMMAVFAFAPFAMANDERGGNAGEGEGAIGCGYFSPCRDVYPTNPPAPPKGEEQQEQQEQQKQQQQRGGQLDPIQQGQQGVSVQAKHSVPVCNGGLNASYNLVNGRWVFAGYVCNPDPGGQGLDDQR